MADQENSERGGGTLDNSILDMFYFSETKFSKNNTKSQRKGVAAAPSAHPKIRHETR